MNGETLKNYARNHGYGNNRLAASMGITSQNLSQQLAKDDIRTSLLERVAAVIGVSPADIYGGNTTNSTSIVGIGSVTDNALLEKAMQENARLIEQNSRLIAIIEKMNK